MPGPPLRASPAARGTFGRLLRAASVLAALAPAACGERRADAPSNPEEVLRRARAARTDPRREATLSGGPAGRLAGVVRDAERREPLAARVLLVDGGGTEAGAALAGTGFWCGGRFSVPLIPGRTRVEVSAGRRRSVAYQELIVRPGRRSRVAVDLRRPAALRFEERGWHGADLFRPVGGGEALRERASLGLLALAARAEGTAFCGAAPPFGPGVSAAADVERECAALSGPGFTIAPAWRGTDAPFYGGMFLIGPRDPGALAPSGGRSSAPSQTTLTAGWDVRRPNFIDIELARAQGAVSILRGIAGGREMDPRAEIVALRPALEILYRDASVALGETACELPFDVAAGVLPHALALSGSSGDEAVWFRLLSMGHRVPSVHVAGGSFAGGVVPAERTFVMLGPRGEPTARNVAEAVRAGRVMASTGPFVFLRIDGRGPGSVLPADGTRRTIIFEAYGSTEKNGEITSLELVRNGEVVGSEPGQGRSFIAARTDRPERETAWYVARARAGGRVAWTSPIYFEGPGYAAPRPVATLVRGRVTDARTGAPLAAAVRACLAGATVAETKTGATGEFAVECSPAALLSASARGHVTGEARVFFHTGAPREIFAIHTNASGRGASVLADEATYERMRLACAEARIDFRLEAAGGE